MIIPTAIHLHIRRRRAGSRPDRAATRIRSRFAQAEYIRPPWLCHQNSPRRQTFRQQHQLEAPDRRGLQCYGFSNLLDKRALARVGTIRPRGASARACGPRAASPDVEASARGTVPTQVSQGDEATADLLSRRREAGSARAGPDSISWRRLQRGRYTSGSRARYCSRTGFPMRHRESRPRFHPRRSRTHLSVVRPPFHDAGTHGGRQDRARRRV